ncbi:MAG TPA: sugar phosphate nucleotidyltransferase [Terriglobia bacterium]|nr:sugar phosphate nucleotidyltransferase [Terriglobia bacterium]
MPEAAVGNTALSMEAAQRTLVKVLILAGGQGERLLPLTAFRPKPLIPLGAGRVIDFTLRNCRNSGLPSALVLTQYRHEQVAAHVRNHWNGQFTCLPPVTGQTYRGTGDAVFQNLALLLEDGAQHVLILSADHVYRMDYRKLIQRHMTTGADATISAISCPGSEASAFGVMNVDEDLRVQSFVEKPSPPPEGTAFVSMGIYMFRMQALVETLRAHCDRKSGFDFGRDIIPSLIGRQRVFAYNFEQKGPSVTPYWKDIGTIDSYYRTCMELARPNPPLMAWDTVTSSESSPGLVNQNGVARVVRSVVSAGVRIEAGARVEDCVLMPNAHVGQGVSLRRVIVDEGVYVPAGTSIDGEVRSESKTFTVSPDGVVVFTSTGPVKAPASPVRSERTIVARTEAALGQRLSAGSGLAS